MTSSTMASVLGDRGLVQRMPTIPGDIDGVRLLAQPLREQLRGARLILDQQYSHQPDTP